MRSAIVTADYEDPNYRRIYDYAENDDKNELVTKEPLYRFAVIVILTRANKTRVPIVIDEIAKAAVQSIVAFSLAAIDAVKAKSGGTEKFISESYMRLSAVEGIA